MSKLIPASEVLLRHSNDLKQSRILFTGDMKDCLPAHFICAESHVHTQFYHHWKGLSCQMAERARFSLVAEKSDVTNCNTLIYYWPKNKLEAKFQLMNLLSLLPTGCDIFVVGENRSGVCSVEKMLKAWAPLNKIDSARRCTLYHGYLENQPAFSAGSFWTEYQCNGLTIKTLPGVFSSDGLDMGSQLLISTLMNDTKGQVMDVGCGAGVVATALASHSPRVNLTLCDVSAFAIEASRATLAANGFEGTVFASNVFSDVTGHYDLIISNPPFHDSIGINTKVAKMLICGAVFHLKIGGELRIVANTFLPYQKLIDEIFGFHEVIVQNSRFKVYRTVMTRQAKNNSLKGYK